MKAPFRATAGLRGRLLASVLVTITLVLAALTAGFNLVLGNRLAAQAAGAVSARAAAELSALRVDRGRIILRESPDQGSPDTSVWVFQARRRSLHAIEAPQSPPLDSGTVARFAAAAPAVLELEHPPVRLRALPVQPGGRRVGVVVAAVSLIPYDQSRRIALIASSVLALIALVAVGLACRWLIGRSLDPVARMTRQAADWSEHDIDRRFDLGEPRDEIGELAATLDGLLSRLAAGMRHEQRLSAELSHELRTPLAGIRAQAQFALRHASVDAVGRGALHDILAATRRMADTLDTLIAAARAQLDLRSADGDALAAARAAAAAAAAHPPNPGITVTVAGGPHPLPVAAESALIERTLAPLLQNAYRYARREIRIELSAAGTRTMIAVLDDGPGVAAEDVEAIFEPGWQDAAATGAPLHVQGAGLGLPLARRLARSAGGEVTAVAGTAGAVFVLELPTAP